MLRVLCPRFVAVLFPPSSFPSLYATVRRRTLRDPPAACASGESTPIVSRAELDPPPSSMVLPLSRVRRLLVRHIDRAADSGQLKPG